MDIKTVFARNLRDRRRACGLSQEALADAAGLDRTYISALEREVYSASISTLDQIARALGVPAFELIKPPVILPGSSD